MQHNPSLTWQPRNKHSYHLPYEGTCLTHRYEHRTAGGCRPRSFLTGSPFVTSLFCASRYASTSLLGPGGKCKSGCRCIATLRARWPRGSVSLGAEVRSQFLRSREHSAHNPKLAAQTVPKLALVSMQQGQQLPGSCWRADWLSAEQSGVPFRPRPYRVRSPLGV